MPPNTKIIKTLFALFSEVGNDIFHTGRIDYRGSTCHIGGQSDCGVGCEVVEGMNNDYEKPYRKVKKRN